MSPSRPRYLPARSGQAEPWVTTQDGRSDVGIRTWIGPDEYPLPSTVHEFVHPRAAHERTVTKVLLASDEPAMLRTLSITLAAHGYKVDIADTSAQVLERVGDQALDVIVLDLRLAGSRGVELVPQIRHRGETPIIVLSEREEEQNCIDALYAGAADFVSKPFGIEEFLVRLRGALGQRETSDNTWVIGTPDFTIDFATKQVTRAGEDVVLTTTEWQLLEILTRNPGRLALQRELLDAVWGTRNDLAVNCLRTDIANVRRKLEPSPSRPKYFRTEIGLGYRFESPREPTPPPPE